MTPGRQTPWNLFIPLSRSLAQIINTDGLYDVFILVMLLGFYISSQVAFNTQKQCLQNKWGEVKMKGDEL